LLQDVQETEKNVCYVDKRAVCPYKGKYYVLKEMENGNFRAVEVKLGSSVGMNIVVEEGLEEGDIVSMID
jgi:multidrug efflux pump subunit AcrA (membrane-fusion protein)